MIRRNAVVAVLAFVLSCATAAGALSVPGGAPPAAAADVLDRLVPGRQLSPGDRLVAPNGSHVLVMQTDGNAVVYAPGGRATWASGTNGSGRSSLRMQRDGNAVVVAPGGRAVWSTGTHGKPGSVLRMQNDGNLVVYAPGNVAVWSSREAASRPGCTKYSPGRWVCGAIAQKYRSPGMSALLGLPVTDELTTPNGVGRYNHFQRGSIYWSPATGAREVHGAIRDEWARAGWEVSRYGFPTTDEHRVQGGLRSVFQNGCMITHSNGRTAGSCPANNAAFAYDRGTVSHSVYVSRRMTKQFADIMSTTNGLAVPLVAVALETACALLGVAVGAVVGGGPGAAVGGTVAAGMCLGLLATAWAARDTIRAAAASNGCFRFRTPIASSVTTGFWNDGGLNCLT